MAVMIFEPFLAVESIVKQVFENFNFQSKSGLLQFWACSTDPDSEDIGCNLTLTDITCNPTQDQGLEDYMKRCFEKLYPFVGRERSMGNWLAGRAAQTGIADQKTTDHVLIQHDQHSEDVGARGQLVVPLYYDQGGMNKLVGIIEYVTPVPKQSYVEDFEQIHNFLKDEALNTHYIGKTIKVAYDGDMIKFRLPLSAKFADLQREVTMRFTDLEHQNFRVEYEDIKGICFAISNDEAFRVCMVESSSKGANFIKMRVSLEHIG